MTRANFEREWIPVTEIEPPNMPVHDTSFARGVTLTYREWCRNECARMIRRGGNVEVVHVAGCICIARRKGEVA